MAGLVIAMSILGGGAAGICVSSALSEAGLRLTTLQFFTEYYNVSTMFRLGAALSTSAVGVAINHKVSGELSERMLLGYAATSFGAGSFTSIASTSTLCAVSPLVSGAGLRLRNTIYTVTTSGDYVVAPLLTFVAVTTVSITTANILIRVLSRRRR